MKKFLLIATSLISSAALFGCVSFETTKSNLVSPPAVHQLYRVTYDENSSTVKAEATFRVGGPGGTTIELVEPTKVVFNDMPLSRTHFLGTYYEIEASARSMAFTWNFTDQAGKEYTNTGKIGAFRVPYIPSHISAKNNLILQYEGSDLASDETIQASFSYGTRSGGAGFTYRLTELLPDHHFQVKMSDLATLAADAINVRVSFLRSRTQPLSRATENGGTLISQYKTRDVAVEIDR